MTSTSTGNKVHFGDDHVHDYSDATRTEAEEAASWYSVQQFEAMRCHAYGLAKTAVLVGDCPRLLHGNSLRGLEKLTGAATSSKRRRNIVRSIVELHQMETSEATTAANSEEIKATLRKYVNKYIEKCRKAARDRAIDDEADARKIYYQQKMMPLVDHHGANIQPMVEVPVVQTRAIAA